MADLAIHVDDLGKQFRIGRQQGGYRTLRETINGVLTKPFRWAAQRPHQKPDVGEESDNTIWALRKVSFNITQGEVVGIIGRNGAGKSTLLKILSQITEPTEGFVDIYGRVAALLEVGTGFHPELTGRENIYLNGAFLGMMRAEIDRKFDGIVAFAGVERFIDTPVKHYSSGMTVRLAFAVAAHLEPEILIIDEVLAVGDAAFQKRCLRKMEGVAKEGRTILFVSHNMTAVQTLCQRVIWLDEGRIAGDGRPSEVVSAYLRMSTATLTDQYWEDRISAPGNDKVRFRRIRIRPQYGSSLDSITVETPFVMEFEYWNLDPGALLNLSLVLYNEQSTAVFNTGPASEAVWHGQPFPSGLFRSACHVPGHLLNDGTHRILLLVVKNQTQIIYRHDDAIVFEVVDVPRTNDAWYGKFPGVVRPDLKWTTELLESDVALKA